MSHSLAEVERLRAQHYNAEVVGITRCHDDLLVLRVRPDLGLPSFEAGQYTVLGLGSWEPRLPGGQAERDVFDADARLIRRAYSVSCSLLNQRGELVRVSQATALEFYIALVQFAGAVHAPALTPRLFALHVGDRLFCSRQLHGHYTLERVQADDTVVFAATGTGEAPHNAMVAELLASGHRGQIVSVTCARWKKDLAYLEAQRQLQQKFDNYLYLPLTTREPENIVPTVADYVGKRYLQDYFATGDFERDAGIQLSPANTHVFLCGSPEMIGVPRRIHDITKRYPQPVGMVEVLEKRGFHVDQPHEPGNVHFEKYW